MSTNCKFYKEEEYVSYDSGETWSAMGVYRKGDLIEYNSEDCGYVPPTPIYEWRRITPVSGDSSTFICQNCYPYGNTKLTMIYNNDDRCIYTLDCDDNPTLSSFMTNPTSAMTFAEIGSCITNIENDTFTDCSNLSSVTIPNSVTYIGYNAFSNTPWYRNYSADTSNHYGNIIYINDIAYKAINTSITSCTFKPSTKTIGERAFSACTSLTSVTILDSVTNIGFEAFYNCTNLTSCTIGSGVTTTGERTFSNCTNLKNVDISNGVTTIGSGSFSGCTSLTSVTIPDSVTSIGNYAFRQCTSLTSVTIPSGVTYIGDYSFDCCTSLTGVTIEAVAPPTLGGLVFGDQINCRPMYYPIYVPAESVDVYKAATNWSEYASRIQAIP